MTIWLAVFRHGLTVLVLALIADLTAQLTWQLVALPPPPLVAAPSTTATTAIAAARPIAADFRDLFGKAAPLAAPPPPAQVAPTQLRATLLGVLHAPTAPRQSRALIAVNDAPEAPFKIGDSLAPNITVHQIDARRVLLSRDGQLEALDLPTETAPPIGASPAISVNANDATAVRQADASSSPSGDDEPALPEQVDATEFATNLRRAFQENPSPDALRTFAVIDPLAQNGQFQGFRVRPGQDRRALFRLGLQTGDVITAVNGQPLANAFQAERLIRSLLTDDQIRLAITRRGREQQATFILRR